MEKSHNPYKFALTNFNYSTVITVFPFVYHLKYPRVIEIKDIIESGLPVLLFKYFTSRSLE